MIEHSTASYLDAANRTRAFLNSPVRLGSIVAAMTAIGAILALLSANILNGWWWLTPIVMLFFFILVSGGMKIPAPASKDIRPTIFSEPTRENPNDISWSGSLGFLFFFPSLFIIARVAESISESAALYPMVICLSAISAAVWTLPNSFGAFPIAKPLPISFADKCPYPAHSPEARVLAVLEVALIRRNYVFFADQLPYFALLNDDQLHPILTALESDGLITVKNNSSALTEKGRARKFVQLTNTAQAS